MGSQKEFDRGIEEMGECCGVISSKCRGLGPATAKNIRSTLTCPTDRNPLPIILTPVTFLLFRLTAIFLSLTMVQIAMVMIAIGDSVPNSTKQLHGKKSHCWKKDGRRFLAT